MINRNFERFQRNDFPESKITLQTLPVGKVSLSIPERFIDRKRGTIDIFGLTNYLEGYEDIYIDYEVE